MIISKINFYFKTIRIAVRFFLVIIVTSTLLMHSCSSDTGTVSSYRVGIVFDEGGKDDMSFNANAWRGASRAVDEFGITVIDVEPGDASMIEPAIRILAEEGFDLIVGVGFATKNAVEKVSRDYPEVQFVIVDSEVDQPNVASLLFEEHEAAFLVGMIAGELSKTGTIGYIGGMKIPLIIRTYQAFVAGAEYVNPDIKVLEAYAGVTLTAWSDPNKGKELALSQIAQNADIIFQAAGGTGMGVFDAVVEENKLAIGSDTNQNSLRPGNILTSMLKNVNIAVYQMIKESYQSSFKPGVHLFNLENNGMGYSVDEYNEALIPLDLIQRVEQAKKEIIAGTLKVPDYYDTLR